MKKENQTYPRILALAPSSRGVGYAVIEGLDTLVDWGVKGLGKGDKNVRSLLKAEWLLSLYQPGLLVLQDTDTKACRRRPRIKALIEQFDTLAESHKVSVAWISQEQVMQTLLGNNSGTKHDVAVAIAKRYPEELESQLPRKRRPWESEDPRMNMFEAVALALCNNKKKTY